MDRRIRPVMRSASAAAGLLLALGLVACGGDDDADAGAGSTGESTVVTDEAQTLPSRPSSPAAAPPPAAEPESEAVTVTATDFALEVDEDGFAAGEVEVTFVNDGGSTHNLVVERDGEELAEAAAVDPGQSSTVTVTLEAGEYVLYCPIGNHRGMGMQTTVRIS